MNEEPLQPKWRTEIKGYLTFVHPKVCSRVAETLGSNAHCPINKKLLSEKSKHISPGDDTWLARLLRRRLEQDAHEVPPEWSAWFHGFGRRDDKGKLYDWEDMPPHWLEERQFFSWRDGEDVLHIEKLTPDLVRVVKYRPKNTSKKSSSKPRVFFDTPFEGQPTGAYRFKTITVNLGLTEVQVIRFPGKMEFISSPVCRCTKCRPWHFHIDEQSNRRFKGTKGKKPFDCITSELKNAPAKWAYPLVRYEIDNAEVDSEVFATLVDGGCVHTIPHKIDGRNYTQHGLTKWTRRQDKPAPNQEITIQRGKELKNLHREEELEMDAARHLKVKGNPDFDGSGRGTGPTAAVASHIRAFEVLPSDGCAWYPNSIDHSAGFLVRNPGAFHWRAQKQDLRIENQDQQNFTEDDTKLLDFVKEKRAYMKRDSLLPAAESPTEMVWDGDDFALVDDRPEYFAYQIKNRSRGRNKTDRERLEEQEWWETKRAKYKAILEAGRGWSPIDPQEDTRFLPSGVKYNLSNPKVKQILYELDQHRENFDTRKGLAATSGLKYETARRIELKDINAKKECPTTLFTAAQIADIKARDGRVVYVHAVTDKPRWYCLDMDRFETYQDAIEGVKRRGKDEALKKNKMFNNPRAPKAKFNHALTEVVARWEEYFWKENIYILDLRTPMLVAIAEEASDRKSA